MAPMNIDYPTVVDVDAPVPHHLPVPKYECGGRPVVLRQSRHELTTARAYYLCWQPTVSAESLSFYSSTSIYAIAMYMVVE